MKGTLHSLSLIILIILLITGGIGCANMMPPTGGPRDSLPPRLLSAAPKDSAKNVRTNRITLTFDEFVEVQGATEQLIVSPTLNNIPTVDSRLKTVTIKLRDSLEPNTTYSINFGNSIRDVNEGNVIKNFTYVFSTGNTIDKNTLTGRVLIAETGKLDSTLIVVLHQNLSDTAILKLRARYYARIDGQGNFQFNNLPVGRFNVFAVPGGASNFYKQYQDSTDLFAFLNQPVSVSDTGKPVTLYAFRQTVKRGGTTTTSTNTPAPTTNKNNTVKTFRYSTNLEGATQDLLSPLILTFERRVAKFDSSQLVLADTAFSSLTGYRLSFDSTRTKLTLTNAWQENTGYKLIIPKTAVADSAGITFAKNDTISFTTKRERDYGSIKLRFNNIDASKNPVLQLVQNDIVVESIIITQREWTRKLYKPGEYELRLLYDTNKNGVWDTGNYFKKLQPEIVKPLDRRLNIKANWDNEVDITL